ncbi:MFS transporter [Oceanobacillus jeddahense]|uniref:MFS transporter n=1 Tax=Oceanobacillus jeddahense TaxID=1462527 RepID=A0ABY5JXE5_9BACI|nr:MFS transporter [Oceanobacillus jeddahense]UUI04741.1 MFS transporter [Oceanobacillus jeddahense]
MDIVFLFSYPVVCNAGDRITAILRNDSAVLQYQRSLLIMFNVFKDKYRMAVAGLLLEGIVLFIMGIALHYYATIAAACLLGLGVCFVSVGLNTMYQTMIPKAMMGRVLSLVSVLLNASVPLGQLFGSMIIEYYSMTLVLTVFGVIVTISLLSLIRVVTIENNETATMKKEV